MPNPIPTGSLDEPGYDGAEPFGPPSPDGSAILALEILFLRVTDRFTRDGTSAQMIFGWREPPRQLASQNRLIWVPGDSSSKLGEFLPPKYPGRAPERPLANLGELFTVYVLAADSTAPHSNDDELKQYRAARLLLDALVRAMALAFTFGSQLRILGAEWITDKTERRFGAGIKVTGAILAVIPDTAVTLAPIDTDAIITSTELSQTDLPVTVTP